MCTQLFIENVYKVNRVGGINVIVYRKRRVIYNDTIQYPDSKYRIVLCLQTYVTIWLF